MAILSAVFFVAPSTAAGQCLFAPLPSTLPAQTGGEGLNVDPGEGGFTQAIQAVTPRVVKLYGLRVGRQPGYGTGIIVSEDGLVLTVASLLIDARNVRTVTFDGTTYRADLVHRDDKLQLALLRLRVSRSNHHPSRGLQPARPDDSGLTGTTPAEKDETLGLPFFDLSVESALCPGDWVLAAGNPFKIAEGEEPASLLHGVFSTRTRLDARRRLKDFPYRGDVLVIDAITSNPGAPGSAVVNLDGELVGMVGRNVLSNLTHTHFNYAVPRDVLYAYLLEATAEASSEFRIANSESSGSEAGLRRKDTTTELSSTSDATERPLDHGIRMSRVGYRRLLPFVERVRPGSPADRAGVRRDDLVLSVNGRSVPDVAAFDARVEALPPGEPIDLVIRRGEAIVSVHIENVETSKRRNVKTSKKRKGKKPKGQKGNITDGARPEDGRMRIDDPCDPQFTSRHPQSAARNPQSTIRDPQSAARNPQSAIRNPQSPVSVVRATQEVFRAVAAALRPSLVRIETVGGSQPPQRLLASTDEDRPARRKRLQNPFRDTPGSDFEVADGPTTGIVYSSDGYIVTSSFNFVREPILISVVLADGRRLPAELVARDQVRKIALLKVDATGLVVPRWAPFTDVYVGQWAIALGLGFGGEHPSVTAGVISALSRMHGNAVQTDAKLSPANYGGPLCDIDGRVIGVCVPMAQRPGELAGIELYDSGIGFAVPENRLDEIVAVLKTGRSFYRGWLGIQIDPRTVDAAVVLRTADPSPMREAGVLPGDVIREVNGERISHFGDIVQALYMLPAGESVELLMERDGSGYAIAVTLARSADLGPLPRVEEPFDPAEPLSTPEDE